MAVPGSEDGALVEVNMQDIVLTPRREAPPVEASEPKAEAHTEVAAAALTEAEKAEKVAMENGHVLGAEDVPPPYSPPLLTLENASGALESYEVPAHVLAFVPPDGGVRAWLVMLASFLCNGIIFGIINTSGIIYVKIAAHLKEAGDPNAAFKGSMMMSLAIGSTFLFSVLAGVLTDSLGIRITTLIGGALSTAGMFISSFFADSVEILMFTYGIMFGVGASLAYTPSLVILGHYFQRRMGIVNGFVTAGSSIFTIGMPFLLSYVLEMGVQTTFQMLAGLTSFLMFAALIFKPLMPILPQSRPQYDNSCQGRCKSFWSRIINFEIWQNKRYVIWALAIPSALFGYFVPYIHLVAYVKEVLGEDINSQLLVQCLGITSLVGRLVFGMVADRPSINRIFLQQVSFFCIGAFTMLLTVANHMAFFMVIALIMGLFDGCFISLLGPIAFDIVGPGGASQAIGCLLAICSIPLTFGPAIAGALYDHLGSYLVPFLCAGVPPILGSFILFSISCTRSLPEGVPGSPVREPPEKQNNAAAVDDPRETHRLMTEEQQSRV
ncbi:monocarboxylate transporter 10-like isoform X3 [Portunus trituberculatus]|uniref:monocarboxylate transporter 10-like isoform X3 n=1 Tax=Portunus trituberculatus TaxID=210409 RepID=UPI001E1CE951|nr:monocarboxylate transporter 10-like isoform X3 [Portunus trituberculatus]